MVKMILDIDGMACGMCESHINDALRKAFHVEKIFSSHSKGKTEIITKDPIDEQALKKVIDATGYTLMNVYTEPYQKKGFS